MAALAFIIPACNAAATLGDTLRSLLAQTRADWAAVVVDDGSTDATSPAATAFTDDSRIRLVPQDNRGLAEARNRGMRECAASGGAEALCFLDADDVVEPRFVEMMLGALEGTPPGTPALRAESNIRETPPFDLAFCSFRMVGPQLEDLDWIIRLGDHDTAPSRLIEYNPCAVGGVVVRWSAAWRAQIQTQHGPGLFDPSLSVHEDWDAWLRLTAPPPLGAGARWAPVVAEPLFCYRQRRGTMSGQLQRMWRTGLMLIEQAPVMAELKPGALRRWTARHIARATAQRDEELISQCISQIGPLVEDELELLAGSLHWAFCQQEQVRPRQIEDWREEAWRLQIADVLEPHVPGVLARFNARGRSAPEAVAAAIHALVREDETLVIYGMGRNGRELLEALAAWRGPVAWMDDDAAAVAPMLHGRPLARLSIGDLMQSHVVVITPDRSSAIMARLSRIGAGRVVTLASLFAAPNALAAPHP